MRILVFAVLRVLLRLFVRLPYSCPAELSGFVVLDGVCVFACCLLTAASSVGLVSSVAGRFSRPADQAISTR